MFKFKTPYWLSATIIAATMFAQSIALPAIGLPNTAAVAQRDAKPAPAPVVTMVEQNKAPAKAPAEAAKAPAAAPAPAPVERKGKLILIDPGHGGSDSGAVHKAGGKTDITEEDATLATALKLAEMLRADGYDVELTRTADTKVVPGGSQGADLQARIEKANKADADLLVSVHYNAAGNPGQRGTEVWYCTDRPFAGDNERLAKTVQESLVRNLHEAGYDTKDNGIKNDAKMGHFAITGPHPAKPSKMPSIIGEGLYMSNDQDAAQLKRPEGIEALAHGYHEGIKAYFGDTK